MTPPENFDGKNEFDLLISSYNSIGDKSRLEIVTDETTKSVIRESLVKGLQIDYTEGDFSLQNLFNMKQNIGSFYICQCLFDFGTSYRVGRGGEDFTHRYNYDIVGFGTMKVDLGNTLLRQKTMGDKLVEHFIHSAIRIDGCEMFNDKFYLTSDKKENVVKFFDTRFVDAISNYDGLSIKAKENKMYLVFENHLDETQARVVEDIFGSFKYWSD
jgi:hypothetical protein